MFRHEDNQRLFIESASVMNKKAASAASLEELNDLAESQEAALANVTWHILAFALQMTVDSSAIVKVTVPDEFLDPIMSEIMAGRLGKTMENQRFAFSMSCLRVFVVCWRVDWHSQVDPVLLPTSNTVMDRKAWIVCGIFQTRASEILQRRQRDSASC